MSGPGRRPTTESFDAIVVGARCAGSPLAMHLARKGLRVCVLERAEFPSDTPSTHGIQPSGVRILRDLGLYDRLASLTTPLFCGTLALDDVRVDIDDLGDTLDAPMLNVRRIVLDGILAEAADGAGADVRTGTPVTGLIEEDGRVAGVETPAGRLRAPVVVGADGVRSTVARLTDAEAGEYWTTQSGRTFLWGYFEGVRDDGRLWLGKTGDDSLLASATDSGLFMAAVTVSNWRRDEVFADREAVHRAPLDRIPGLAESLEGARLVSPIRVMSNWRGYFRPSAGPGWALVGDAGHFKDPTPGQGIADALRQGAALAGAIERGLGAEGRSLDEELKRWWRWRDKDAWEMYWFAQDMAEPGPTSPLVQEMQRKIASDPRLTAKLARVLSHDLRPSKLYTVRMAMAAIARCLARERGHRREVLGKARAIAGDQVGRELMRLRGAAT